MDIFLSERENLFYERIRIARSFVRPESNVFMCHIHGENQKWFYYTAAAAEWTTPIMDNGWYTTFAHFYDASGPEHTKKKKTEKSLVKKNGLRSIFGASQWTHSFTLALLTPPAAVQNLELDSFHFCPMNWISIRWSRILSRFFRIYRFIFTSVRHLCLSIHMLIQKLRWAYFLLNGIIVVGIFWHLHFAIHTISTLTPYLYILSTSVAFVNRLAQNQNIIRINKYVKVLLFVAALSDDKMNRFALLSHTFIFASYPFQLLLLIPFQC